MPFRDPKAKTEYQRSYMRRWRARQRGETPPVSPADAPVSPSGAPEKPRTLLKHQKVRILAPEEAPISWLDYFPGEWTPEQCERRREILRKDFIRRRR